MKTKTLSVLALEILLTIAASSPAQTTFTKITSGPVVNDSANSLGAAWVDFDDDGDLDLYVNDGKGANLCYRNDGQGVFTKITTGPAVNQGFSVSWADMDNDGRIDLFSGTQNSGGRLFRQQSAGVFNSSSVAVGFCLGAAWADYDNDGFVDLLAGDTTQNVLWRNNGQGGLVAVRNTAINNAGAIAWADYDKDGDMDVLIAGTGGTRLYRNDGHGIFTETTSDELRQRGTFASEPAWGDYDNDGFPDFYLPRLDSDAAQSLASILFRNKGNGTFAVVEQSPFTTDTGFAIGCSWADHDNDGWLDLFITENLGAPNRLYRNNRDGTFSRVLSGPIGGDPGNCAGSLWGDYNRDGFLDLFVATSFGPASAIQPNDYLYHNDGNSNGWITIKCVGTRSNRSAIGAKVRVKATIGGKSFWQLREITTGAGWGGNPLEAHFGLGNATTVETLRIEWPSGTVQEFQNVAAKQYLPVTEPSRLLVSVTNGVPQLSLHGGRNLQYEIQTSTNLAVWSLFNTLTITNLDGMALIADTNVPSSGGLFYRAMLR